VVNIAGLLKAYDAFLAVRAVAEKFKGALPPPPPRDTGLATAQPASTAPLEARLTNVVVAALKEAFDRDHARLEMQRAQLEEERRRSEETLRLELRRQAVDRDVTRLRLLAGAALLAWMASVFVLGPRVIGAAVATKVVLGSGWALLLGALASAFIGQERAGTALTADAPGSAASWALWLLVAGLALTAISILL
jgi:hypothetical protein